MCSSFWLFSSLFIVRAPSTCHVFLSCGFLFSASSFLCFYTGLLKGYAGWQTSVSHTTTLQTSHICHQPFFHPHAGVYILLDNRVLVCLGLSLCSCQPHQPSVLRTMHGTRHRPAQRTLPLVSVTTLLCASSGTVNSAHSPSCNMCNAPQKGHPQRKRGTPPVAGVDGTCWN